MSSRDQTTAAARAIERAFITPIDARSDKKHRAWDHLHGREALLGETGAGG